MCSLIQESDQALSKHRGLMIHGTFEWWNEQVFKTCKIHWLDENDLHVKHTFPLHKTLKIVLVHWSSVCASSTISCSLGVRGVQTGLSEDQISERCD